MKINQNQVVNSRLNETRDISKTSKTSNATNSANVSNQNSTSTIFIKNSTYKSTFSLQEFISQIQMKISSISLFQQNEDPNIINNATYNNIPLFNKEEKEEIFNKKVDLSELIKNYDIKIQQIRTNINNILEENSNSVVTISEKELKAITNSIYNMLPNNFKGNSTTTILDLLK